MAHDVNSIPVHETTGRHVLSMHKHDSTKIIDTAIAVVEIVDGGVVLVVTANGHHQQLPVFKLEIREWVDCKVGSPGRRREPSLARAIGKGETSGLTDPIVVPLKSRDRRLDEVSNPIVVPRERGPVKTALPVHKRLLGDSRHDRDLGAKMLR
jgi:hypothetical protein